MDFALLKAAGVGGVLGAAVVALLGFLFRESIKAALTRSLTVQAEQLKFALQREMLKAQLSTNEVHALYPKLFGKMHRANGLVAGHFGLRFAPSFDDYSLEDFERTVLALNLPGKVRDRLVSELKRDRDSGVRELKKVMRKVELERARLTVLRVKNFIILHALGLSVPVKEKALELWGSMWSAWVDMSLLSEPAVDGPDRARFYRQAYEAIQRADVQLKELERLMHDDMHPRDGKTVSG